MTKTGTLVRQLLEDRSREDLDTVIGECHPGGRPVETAIRLAGEMNADDAAAAMNEACRNLENRIIALEEKLA